MKKVLFSLIVLCLATMSFTACTALTDPKNKLSVSGGTSTTVDFSQPIKQQETMSTLPSSVADVLWLNETGLADISKIYLGMSCKSLLALLKEENLSFNQNIMASPFSIYIDSDGEAYCIVLDIFSKYNENNIEKKGITTRAGLLPQTALAEIEALYGKPSKEFVLEDQRQLYYLYIYDESYLEFMFEVGQELNNEIERENWNPVAQTLTIYRVLNQSLRIDWPLAGVDDDIRATAIALNEIDSNVILCIDETRINQETKMYLGLQSDIIINELTDMGLTVENTIVTENMRFRFDIDNNIEYIFYNITEPNEISTFNDIYKGMNHKEVIEQYGEPFNIYSQDDGLFLMYAFEDFYLEFSFNIGSFPDTDIENSRLTSLMLSKKIDDCWAKHLD